MKRNYLVAYKVFFGLLGFSAIVTELAILGTKGILIPANFFSFFTIEANIITFIVFLTSAFFVFAGKKSKRLDFFRGAATFFMIVTGIVFAVLLSGLEGVALTALPWDNVVLHYIIPIAAALDWILDPPSKRVSFRRGLLWLIFPLLYLGYSLIRGPIAQWYPYPFLNPANGGYGQIAITSLIILIVGVLLVWIVTRIGKKAK